MADTKTQNPGTQSQSAPPSAQGVSDRVTGMASQMGDKVSQTAQDYMNQAREAAHGYVNQAREMVQDQPVTSPRPEHREGVVARTLEMQTAKIPSDAWLWAAFGSIGLSLAFELSGREKTANFIGHWAPTFLIFGLYNKMVKLQGSDGQ